MPDTNLDKLKDLLAELFMLDQADLDFGIYRVMNAKRAEVTRFLESDLLPQVRQTLESTVEIQTGDRAKDSGERNWPRPSLHAQKALGITAEQAETITQGQGTLRAQPCAAPWTLPNSKTKVLSDLSTTFSADTTKTATLWRCAATRPASMPSLTKARK